jgi:hypothetical protein
MTRLARTLSDGVQVELPPLHEIKAQTVRVLRDLGNLILTALAPLVAPARPTLDVSCSCGQYPDICACACAGTDDAGIHALSLPVL